MNPIIPAGLPYFALDEHDDQTMQTSVFEVLVEEFQNPTDEQRPVRSK